MLRWFSSHMTAPLVLFASNGILAALQLGSSSLLARVLGAEQRGVLAALLVLPMSLAGAAVFGIHLSAARLAAAEPAAARAIYKLAAAALVPPLSIAALAMPAVLRLDSSVTWFHVGLAGAILVSSVANTLQIQVEISRNAMAAAIAARIGFAVLHLGFIVYLILCGYRSATPFFVAFAAASVIAPIVTALMTAFGRRPSRSPLSREMKSLSLLKRSVPDGVATLISAAVSTADRALIAFLMPPAALGYYVVASATAQIQSIFSEAMAPLFFARVAAQGKMLDRLWIADRVRQGLLINIGAALLVLLAAPVVLPFFFGHGYTDAIAVAILLTPAYALNAARRPLEEILKGAGYSLHQSRAQVIALGTFIVFGIPAAATQHVLWVAGATLAAACAGILSAAVSVRATIGLTYAQLFIPTTSDLNILLARFRWLFKWQGNV